MVFSVIFGKSYKKENWEARAHVSGSVPPKSKVGHVRSEPRIGCPDIFLISFHNIMCYLFVFQNAVVLRAPALQGESSL